MLISNVAAKLRENTPRCALWDKWLRISKWNHLPSLYRRKWRWFYNNFNLNCNSRDNNNDNNNVWIIPQYHDSDNGVNRSSYKLHYAYQTDVASKADVTTKLCTFQYVRLQYCNSHRHCFPPPPHSARHPNRKVPPTGCLEVRHNLFARVRHCQHGHSHLSACLLHGETADSLRRKVQRGMETSTEGQCTYIRMHLLPVFGSTSSCFTTRMATAVCHVYSSITWSCKHCVPAQFLLPAPLRETCAENESRAIPIQRHYIETEKRTEAEEDGARYNWIDRFVLCMQLPVHGLLCTAVRGQYCCSGGGTQRLGGKTFAVECTCEVSLWQYGVSGCIGLSQEVSETGYLVHFRVSWWTVAEYAVCQHQRIGTVIEATYFKLQAAKFLPYFSLRDSNAVFKKPRGYLANSFRFYVLLKNIECEVEANVHHLILLYEL